MDEELKLEESKKPEAKKPDEAKPDEVKPVVKARVPAKIDDAVITLAQRQEDAEERLEALEKNKEAPKAETPHVVGAEPPKEQPGILARALRAVASAMDD